MKLAIAGYSAPVLEDLGTVVKKTLGGSGLSHESAMAAGLNSTLSGNEQANTGGANTGNTNTSPANSPRTRRWPRLNTGRQNPGIRSGKRKFTLGLT